MDYSQLPHDPDHPAGTSPWNTSPRVSARPSFAASASGSEPSSPALTSSAAYGQDSLVKEGIHDEGSAAVGSEAFGRREIDHSTSSQATNEDKPVSTESSTTNDNTVSPEGSQGQPQTKQGSAQQGSQPGKQNTPSRYQGGTRSAQRPNYKLQAKITGLERNGRKDPILRFDVHVSPSYAP